jgi:hypothetical protein
LIAAADPMGCIGGAAGSGGELRLLKGLHYLVQDDAGPLEVCLAEFGSQCIGPRCLRRLDRAQGGVSRWREPQQLGAAVAGIGLLDGQAVADQEVGQALHALPGQVQSAGNLRHRGGFVLDRFQDQPARQGLASGLGQRLPNGGEAPGEPDDLAEEGGEGIPGGRSRGRLDIAIDNMLSYGARVRHPARGKEPRR